MKKYKTVEICCHKTSSVFSLFSDTLEVHKKEAHIQSRKTYFILQNPSAIKPQNILVMGLGQFFVAWAGSAIFGIGFGFSKFSFKIPYYSIFFLIDQ